MERVPLSGFRWSAREAGARLAIAAFVLAQFVEITFFHVVSVPVTAQKLAALLAFPLALLLIGGIRAPARLLVLAALLLLAFTMRDLTGAVLDPRTLSASSVVLIGLAGAVVLFTALESDPRALGWLASTWIAFAAATAVVAILQAFGLVPMFTPGKELLGGREVMPGVSLYRGVGLKEDPNFQSLMLCIGLVFSQFRQRKGMRTCTSALLALGVVATFSRMGLLLAVLILAAAPIARASSRGRIVASVRSLATVAMVGIGLALFVRFVSPATGTYLENRFGDVVTTYEMVLGEDVPRSSPAPPSSARARLLLAVGAIDLGARNWGRGIGAFRTEAELRKTTGLSNVSHNTYLELFVIGGVWGLLCVVWYAHLLLRGLRSGEHRAGGHQHARLIACFLLVFGFTGFFLSLTYNSIIWLPVVLALAGPTPLRSGSAPETPGVPA